MSTSLDADGTIVLCYGNPEDPADPAAWAWDVLWPGYRWFVVPGPSRWHGAAVYAVDGALRVLLPSAYADLLPPGARCAADPNEG